MVTDSDQIEELVREIGVIKDELQKVRTTVRILEEAIQELQAQTDDAFELYHEQWNYFGRVWTKFNDIMARIPL